MPGKRLTANQRPADEKMITMNGMDKVTRGAAERARQRVGAGPPLANAEPPDLHGPRPAEFDWAADHIG